MPMRATTTNNSINVNARNCFMPTQEDATKNTNLRNLRKNFFCNPRNIANCSVGSAGRRLALGAYATGNGVATGGDASYCLRPMIRLVLFDIDGTLIRTG